MTTTVRLQLAPGVELTAGHDGPGTGAAVAVQSARLRLTATSRQMSALFQALGKTGLPIHRGGLVGDPGHAAVPGALSRLQAVERLSRLGWLACAIRGHEGELALALPVSGATSRPRLGEVPDGPIALSRFASATFTPDGLLLGSPRSEHRVLSRHPAVLGMLAALGTPTTADELAAGTFLRREETGAVLDLLAGVGMLCRVRPDGSLDEDADVAMRQWEPHDLAFHVRTRAGLDSGTTGATYRFRGEVEPLPAIKPRGSGRTVPLEGAPDRDDVALDDVLRRRRSRRDHHPDRSITLRQLGHLLHRSARITSVQQVGGDEVVYRPYPGGGGLHELELYLVVARCEGLPAGVYHYRAADHELEHVSDPTDATDALLLDAGFSTGSGRGPQILLVMAARFPRLSWKYESIAYSLVLKHVGCLIQTLYLVATSMGLAPCAIGGGDSAQFARVLPGSPYAETSVGEFALGVPPPEARPSAKPRPSHES